MDHESEKSVDGSGLLDARKRHIQKMVFAFAYHGTFNVKLWKKSRVLGLRSIELCKGTHGYQYALIRIVKRKRASHIQKIFESYDLEATSVMQIRLVKLPGELCTIVSFGSGDEFMDHVIYKEIEKAKKNKCINYFSWRVSGVRSSSGATSSFSESEYSELDVVKKRRKMDLAMDDSESTPTALVAFEEFEASVLTALERVADDENEYRRREMVGMEKCLANGEANVATGGVYFAWSQCLGCMKIGATRKEDPHVRLRQLSSLVTTPFILAAWQPTPRPFQLEASVHLHFKQQRINQRGSGAGTEFFRIGVAEAVSYAARLGSSGKPSNYEAGGCEGE